MLNKAIIMGRLGAAPELRTTPTGEHCCSFRVAVPRNYKDKDGNPLTDWISCVAWRTTAEFINKYFDKGSVIIVEGAISSRSYTDKDQKTVYITEIVVDKAYFGASSEKKNSNDPPPIPAPAPVPSKPYPDAPSASDFAETDDDYPF